MWSWISASKNQHMTLYRTPIQGLFDKHKTEPVHKPTVWCRFVTVDKCSTRVVGQDSSSTGSAWVTHESSYRLVSGANYSYLQPTDSIIALIRVHLLSPCAYCTRISTTPSAMFMGPVIARPTPPPSILMCLQHTHPHIER